MTKNRQLRQVFVGSKIILCHQIIQCSIKAGSSVINLGNSYFEKNLNNSYISQIVVFSMNASGVRRVIK